MLKVLSSDYLDFDKSFKRAFSKIKNFSNYDKTITIFWLLGPLIFLIERDPADLWLTLITIFFIIKSYRNKDWSWSKQLWFKLSLILWFISLVSALMSPTPLFSFWQGFVWFRFPLYAAAAQAWLGHDKDIRVFMFVMMLVGTLIMCLILTLELIHANSIFWTEPWPKMRLEWPYGDKIPGSYLSKAMLQVFCVLIALSLFIKKKSAIWLCVIATYSLAIAFLTGERINFIARTCAGILSALVWRPFKIRLFILFILSISTIGIILHKNPILLNRYSTDFIDKINFTSGNWGAWRGGIQQGLESPIIGIGPSGTRFSCIELSQKKHWLPGENYCGNHPHNFYVQLFAETGLLGLTFGTLMFLSIIWTCFKARLSDRYCPMAATCFIVPLACFFPLQQFGSFFGQWGNLFIWFGVGFALSQAQQWRKNKA
ncbi:O-antigen ligase family protein [Pseudomonadota bacterium]|jgi:O-antigen ligase|nr:O-antigen ligase family protein [Pseudomonadota bacterium]